MATAHHCFESLIINVTIYDGSGEEPFIGNVLIKEGLIAAVSPSSAPIRQPAKETINGEGLALAPGFIDTHCHDDLRLISEPELLCKLSQGVTTVIVGNCGISASPTNLERPPVEPMNLLGPRDEFQYSTFVQYRAAVEKAQPAVNVAALVGHTSLRQKFMEGSLDRAASEHELEEMRSQLRQSLRDGAVGLSTGLAYASAKCAPKEEIRALAAELTTAPTSIYATHMRSEGDQILAAIDEAFTVVPNSNIQVVVSHLKCNNGTQNWGRSKEVLAAFEEAVHSNPNIGYDCYPYSAGSTILDLEQVTSDYDISITWSVPHPEMSGRDLADIAKEWNVSLLDAARRLQPGGAIYHSMHEDDVRRILAHPLSMIGSDGLPNDRVPHPRLWGTFPRVIRHYCLELGLFPMAEAIRKMTSLPAKRFRLNRRGLIKEGYWADLVLFDPRSIRDRATFENSTQAADGIEAVWVNGILTYSRSGGKGRCVGRAGRFLPREENR